METIIAILRILGMILGIVSIGTMLVFCFAFFLGIIHLVLKLLTAIKLFPDKIMQSIDQSEKIKKLEHILMILFYAGYLAPLAGMLILSLIGLLLSAI